MISDEELIALATKAQNSRDLSGYAEAGDVGSVLVTDKGNLYTGVCIDTSCSLGFCAEQNAIGSMVTSGENRIISIVAVKGDKIVSPCGRCREFIWQVHVDNKNTRVLLKDNKVVLLKELLPEHWKEGEPHD